VARFASEAAAVDRARVRAVHRLSVRLVLHPARRTH
jgi:hypothetical protein